jgi:hypothetical protein
MVPDEIWHLKRSSEKMAASEKMAVSEKTAAESLLILLS